MSYQLSGAGNGLDAIRVSVDKRAVLIIVDAHITCAL